MNDEPSGTNDLVLRGLAPGDLGWVVERHAVRYFEMFGWDWTFEALVARITADYVTTYDPVREAGWIAVLNGRRVGSVFCTAADAKDTAQLRLLLVEPEARSAGVGTELVEECLRFAISASYARIELWTEQSLVAARRIYHRAGFRLDATEPESRFGAELVSEYWSRPL